MLPLHHIRKRKKLHPYPAKKLSYRILDVVIYLVSIMGPFSTLPQLYLIWTRKSSAGVSATTWSIYAYMAGVWLLYGIVHREKPIIISNALWILVEVLVVVSAMMYK